jgi:hypothetical protein
MAKRLFECPVRYGQRKTHVRYPFVDSGTYELLQDLKTPSPIYLSLSDTLYPTLLKVNNPALDRASSVSRGIAGIFLVSTVESFNQKRSLPRRAGR